MGQIGLTVICLSPSCTRGPSKSREPPATRRARVAAFPRSPPAQKDHHHVEHDAPGTEDDAGPFDRSRAAAEPTAGTGPGSGRRAGEGVGDPRAPGRSGDEALQRRPEEGTGDRDRERLDAPRARRDDRDPRRQRLRQVDADQAHLGPAHARRGPGRGLRPRHRARGDGRQAPHQPGERGRGLLQEAEPDGEPAVRGAGSTGSTPSWPAARRSGSRSDSASPRSD